MKIVMIMNFWVLNKFADLPTAFIGPKTCCVLYMSATYTRVYMVLLYINRKSAILCFSERSLLFSKTCLVRLSLNNLTALSAAPFDAG